MANKSGSKREASFAASRRLRERYEGEFQELLAEEYKLRGIPVPLTREERARQQIEKLMVAYPQVVRNVVDEHKGEPLTAESDSA